MDYLEARNLIKPWSRSELLGDKLVLIAPAIDHMTRLDIEPGFPLRAALGNGRLAMADPASAPAGIPSTPRRCPVKRIPRPYRTPAIRHFPRKMRNSAGFPQGRCP